MKKVFKKILVITLKCLLGIAVFVGLYLLTAYLCKYVTVNDDYVVPENGIEVFVISNGVHADICLPILQEDSIWNEYFKVQDFKTLTNSPKYISFGWGDKGFFLDTPTWADLTFSTAFSALFIPSPAAIHVSYLDKDPVISETTKSFKVDKAAFEKMKKYILATITLKNNSTILIDCCRYPDVHDNFYEANYSYHLFRTCNVWTNQVIKEGGVKTSVWSPFDTGILYQFEEE